MDRESNINYGPKQIQSPFALNFQWMSWFCATTRSSWHASLFSCWLIIQRFKEEAAKQHSQNTWDTRFVSLSKFCAQKYLLDTEWFLNLRAFPFLNWMDKRWRLEDHNWAAPCIQEQVMDHSRKLALWTHALCNIFCLQRGRSGGTMVYTHLQWCKHVTFMTDIFLLTVYHASVTIAVIKWLVPLEDSVVFTGVRGCVIPVQFDFIPHYSEIS